MSGGKRHRATIGALDQGRLVHELMRRAYEPPHSAGISAKNASDLRKKTTSGVNGCPAASRRLRIRGGADYTLAALLFIDDPLLRPRFLGASEAIAKSTCRLNASTRTTKTRTSSPILNRLRDRLPTSCRRAGSNK